MKTKLMAAAAVLALSAGVVFAATANFSEGFNNLKSTHWMRGRDVITMPFGARDFNWFNDFWNYEEEEWVVTEVSDSTQVLGDANGGELVLTTLTTENDMAALQSVKEVFTFAAGKKMYFEARIKPGLDATQSDYVIGLQIRDTTPIATITDGVYFIKDDGDALLDFHSMSGSVDTAALGIHTVVESTYIKVAFYYDGVSTFTYAVDDVVLGNMTATPTATELTVSFAALAGTTAAVTLAVDYINVWRER